MFLYYYLDLLGREIFKAYGITFYISTTNGPHERNLAIFCRINSYSFTSILEIIWKKVELINTWIRAKYEYEGNIKIQFKINLENLEENEFDI